MQKILLSAVCLIALVFSTLSLAEGHPVQAVEDTLNIVESPEIQEDSFDDVEALPEIELQEDAEATFAEHDFAPDGFSHESSEVLLLEDDDAGAVPSVNSSSDPVELSNDESAQTAPQDTVTPHTDPDGPQFDAQLSVLGVGEKLVLGINTPDGSESDITLASSDTAIAKVTKAGKVTAIAPGEAIITATDEEGRYSECYVSVKYAPDKVAFDSKDFILGKGETTNALHVILSSDAGECAGGLNYKSNDDDIVKVDKNGTLTGIKTGSTSITVVTYNGKKASCAVTVLKAPNRIALSSDRNTLGIGEKCTLRCTFPKGSFSHVLYKSDNPDILSVDSATGEITAISLGKAEISANTHTGKSDSIALEVVAAPESISFPDETLRLGVGMELPVEAFVNDGAGGGISYTVKKKKIATYKNGSIRGVKKGKTTLIATTYNGLTAKCPVVVVTAPKSVKLPYKTLDIAVNQRFSLTPDVGSSASTFSYSSDNNKVVKVSKAGTIRGVKKGSATVTVTTYNNKKFKLKVNVIKPAGSVTLSADSLELGILESEQLSCTFPEGATAGVTYESLNPEIAAVDPQTGLVTGIAPGETTISVTTHNGKTDSAIVRVLKSPEWIGVPDEFLVMGAGQTYNIVAEMNEGSRSPLTYTSSDSHVATVSTDGVITAVKKGQATIIVSTNVPGVEASLVVTVRSAPKKVKVKNKTKALNVGDTYQIEPIIAEGAFASFTYESSDETVATVSEEGFVVALSRGKTILTVTTYNGKSVQIKLTVEDPWFPTKIELTNAPAYIGIGESIQLLWKVEPEEAVAEMEWVSQNETVAVVDSDGILTGVGIGYTNIIGTSQRNTDIVISFTVGVQTDAIILEIPARTTSTSGIGANLEKIDAIRQSAIKQIEMLREGGVISGSDASKRKTIINNAFKDYAFPWITLKKQVYWKKANSEGGAKDFKPGRVYYGMPYISGSSRNREYNAAKALKENRYYDSGEGYYVLNQKNLLKGKYCGNDCSCFVDAAIWGTNSSHSNDRTADIAKSSAYQTIKGFDSMRTGDLICKGGSHVVMFLYYVTLDKSQIMIIENGGIEAGTNTVHCMIMKTKWYKNRSYKVRRLKGL